MYLLDTAHQTKFQKHPKATANVGTAELRAAFAIHSQGVAQSVLVKFHLDCGWYSAQVGRSRGAWGCVHRGAVESAPQMMSVWVKVGVATS